MFKFKNMFLLATSQLFLAVSPLTNADSSTQYTPNVPHAIANWNSLTNKVDSADFSDHTPDARPSPITGD